MRLQILCNFAVHKPHTKKTCLTEPLRRNVEHHCETIEPIQRNIWPHCGTIEHFSSKAKKTCANIESLCRINKSFLVNQCPPLQGENACETSCQNTARTGKSIIDVKAVLNHYENSYEIIIPRNCHMIVVQMSDQLQCTD